MLGLAASNPVPFRHKIATWEVGSRAPWTMDPGGGRNLSLTDNVGRADGAELSRRDDGDTSTAAKRQKV